MKLTAFRNEIFDFRMWATEKIEVNKGKDAYFVKNKEEKIIRLGKKNVKMKYSIFSVN